MTDVLWWEFSVIADPALEESLGWVFQSLGCQGTASQITHQTLKLWGYFPENQVSEADLALKAEQVRQAVAHWDGVIAQVTWQRLQEEDWASSWKDHWHPTAIGDRLLIHPAWLPEPTTTDRLVLRLDPGVAFGTGAHATTQLCLIALEQQFAHPVSHPFTLADIGCGTGILAIAALQLGADHAIAVDIDPLAVQAAQECRDLNAIDAHRMVVLEGSMAAAIVQSAEPVDGFCCNILAPVLIELAPQMAILSKPKGWGILSGLLDQQVPDVMAALSAQGWQLAQRWQQEDWACLKVIRCP